MTELRTVQPGGDLLTDFQKDKFRYFFFHVLDLNSDNVISAEDFDRLNEVRMPGKSYISLPYGNASMMIFESKGTLGRANGPSI